MVFDKEENAQTEEQTEAIEFPDTIDEAQHEIANHVNETNDSYGLENITAGRGLIPAEFSECCADAC